jgi:hypothetical protein
MAEITLADYTGYIFLEIIKAREMADRHSRQLAEVYAQDPVLRHFSVPRFKVPKMELTIPLLISGARFNQLISFNLPQDKFVAYVMGRVKEVVSVVLSKGDNPFEKRFEPKPVVVRTEAPQAVGDTPPKADAPPIEALCAEFWLRLKENPDPSQPGEIVRKMWAVIFERALVERELMELYKKSNPNNELYRSSLEDVLKAVTTATVVDRTTIQSLLVNPETNVVKNGSSDTSVFTLKAEMLEEGFFIRTVRDEATGQTRTVVEFE